MDKPVFEKHPTTKYLRCILAFCATVTGAPKGVAAAIAWTGSCLGGVPLSTPAPGTLILPPAVPQPVSANDIVGVNLQNTGSSPTNGNALTFGQVFQRGQVKPTDQLVARIYGAAHQVQMDSQSLWPDGSVKLAALTLAVNICARSALPVLLSRSTSSDPTFPTSPVSLATVPLYLRVTLKFVSGSYTGTRTIYLGRALEASLANAPDYWLRGPLATQARVDVPLTGGSPTDTLHLTADVTAYADGSVSADVQFNNDLTAIISDPFGGPPSLPPLVYSATIALQGQRTTYSVKQYHYQDWHVVLSSLGDPSMNVQHDVAYLERTGAILPYDLTTGVLYNPGDYHNAYANIENARNAASYSVSYPDYPTGGGITYTSPGFGQPLSPDGVSQQMPNTVGGRTSVTRRSTIRFGW